MAQCSATHARRLDRCSCTHIISKALFRFKAVVRLADATKGISSLNATAIWRSIVALGKKGSIRSRLPASNMGRAAFGVLPELPAFGNHRPERQFPAGALGLPSKGDAESFVGGSLRLIVSCHDEIQSGFRESQRLPGLGDRHDSWM